MVKSSSNLSPPKDSLLVVENKNIQQHHTWPQQCQPGWLDTFLIGRSRLKTTSLGAQQQHWKPPKTSWKKIVTCGWFCSLTTLSFQLSQSGFLWIVSSFKSSKHINDCDYFLGEIIVCWSVLALVNLAVAAGIAIGGCYLNLKLQLCSLVDLVEQLKPDAPNLCISTSPAPANGHPSISDTFGNYQLCSWDASKWLQI